MVVISTQIDAWLRNITLIKIIGIANIHELAQPLHDLCTNAMVSPDCPTANQHEERLQGKHFPVIRYLHEKNCCVVYG